MLLASANKQLGMSKLKEFVHKNCTFSVLAESAIIKMFVP